MEGYGIMASTTSANLAVNIRYGNASSTNIVGALEQGVGNAVTIASSSIAVTDQVVRVDYKAAVNILTPPGTYQDIVTFICSTSP